MVSSTEDIVVDNITGVELPNVVGDCVDMIAIPTEMAVSVDVNAGLVEGVVD